MTFDPARMVSFDLETHMLEAGLLAPRIVCGSTARIIDLPGETPKGRLLDRVEALEFIESVLKGERGERVIVGANIAFDFGCLVAHDASFLPLIFKAYEEHRVFDIQIAQALHAIAEGQLGLDPRTGGPLINPDTRKQTNRYSLATCVDLCLGRLDAKKNDYWRTRYAILENVPLADWPEDARQYPVDDAVNTLEVAIAQVIGGGAGCTPGPHRNLGDLSAQVETAFALHLGAMWGLRTDREHVEALRTKTEAAHASFVTKYSRSGFFKADGKEDRRAVKRAVIAAYGGATSGPGSACPGVGCVDGKVLSPKSGNPVNCKDCSGTGLDVGATPRTPTGGVSADRDTLMESGDLDLVAYGENEAEKIRDTYLPFLESGLERPISLRPNILVASGRTSYDGLIQLLPRSGGVRECFKARPGYVYCSVDYAALELCTLAQVCLWILKKSQMAETINATGDPGSLHTAFAAAMAGKTPEEMAVLIKAKDENAKKYRQAAKAANFGFPGGMGAAKLVFAKRKKSEGTTTAPDGTVYPGVRFCILLAGAERCGVSKVTDWKGKPTPPICRACVEVVERDLRPAWFKQWPEIREYFAWVTRRVEEGGEFPCLGTERIRGGLDFTNGANNGFQALAADGAKNALRAIVRECYLDRGSVLYGTRPIMFVHDESVAEVPIATAHLAGPRMAKVMVDSMRELVRDVTIKAEPALMFYLTKDAEPVYRDDTLIPWTPKEMAA